jgi:hypothetical protein
MRGAVPPLPNTPSQGGAQLKMRDNSRACYMPRPSYPPPFLHLITLIICGDVMKLLIRSLKASDWKVPDVNNCRVFLNEESLTAARSDVVLFPNPSNPEQYSHAKSHFSSSMMRVRPPSASSRDKQAADTTLRNKRNFYPREMPYVLPQHSIWFFFKAGSYLWELPLNSSAGP